MGSFDFSMLDLHNLFHKESSDRWFVTPSRLCNVTVMQGRAKSPGALCFMKKIARVIDMFHIYFSQSDNGREIITMTS